MVAYVIVVIMLIKLPKAAYPEITQPWYADNSGALGIFNNIGALGIFNNIESC